MSADLNRQCAEAMGYTVYHYDKDYEANCYYMLMDAAFDPVVGMFKGERKTEAEAWADVPRFTDDAHLLEDEIERRGLQEQYIEALDAAVPRVKPEVWQTYAWHTYVRATPEQRCQAFIEVMKGATHGAETHP